MCFADVRFCIENVDFEVRNEFVLMELWCVSCWVNVNVFQFLLPVDLVVVFWDEKESNQSDEGLQVKRNRKQGKQSCVVEKRN